jgi:hypothetical protein
MMVDVSSRPGSVRSLYGSEAGSSEDEDSQEDDEDDEEQEDDRHDARSIKSFESMMGRATRRRRQRQRKSLSDRLANMPGLARLAGPRQIQVCIRFRMFYFVRDCPLIFVVIHSGYLVVTVATNVAPSSSSRTDSRCKSHRYTFVKSPNVSCASAHRCSESTLFGSSRGRSPAV